MAQPVVLDADESAARLENNRADQIQVAEALAPELLVGGVAQRGEDGLGLARAEAGDVAQQRRVVLGGDDGVELDAEGIGRVDCALLRQPQPLPRDEGDACANRIPPGVLLLPQERWREIHQSWMSRIQAK